MPRSFSRNAGLSGRALAWCRSRRGKVSGCSVTGCPSVACRLKHRRRGPSRRILQQMKGRDLHRLAAGAKQLPCPPITLNALKPKGTDFEVSTWTRTRENISVESIGESAGLGKRGAREIESPIREAHSFASLIRSCGATAVSANGPNRPASKPLNFTRSDHFSLIFNYTSQTKRTLLGPKIRAVQ